MVIALESLDKLITILKKIPNEIILPEHIGTKMPKVVDDLPSIVVSIKKITESPIGIGGIISSEKIEENVIKEIKGFKAVAIYQMDIWVNSPQKIEEITNTMMEILFKNKNELRKKGFVSLSIKSIGEIESKKIGRKDAWRKKVTYSGTYEMMVSETMGPEGIIKKICVDINSQFRESTEIP